MQHTKIITFLALPWLLSCLNADTLVLRDGTSVQGTFLGGSVRQIDFLTSAGKTLHESLADVTSLTFSPPPPAVARQGEAPAQGQRPAVTIPAGTEIRVRTLDPIDVDVAKTGTQFRGTTDDPIMSGGAVVVPRGSPVVLVATKVQQGGSLKGSDAIQLKVSSISVGGKPYQIVTTMADTKAASEGKKTARRSLGGAGLGAAIGGLAGGGSGAGIGALVGGAAGVAASAGGSHLKIPAETRLQFQLASDWKIQ
jgi:hypothetical protein